MLVTINGKDYKLEYFEKTELGVYEISLISKENITASTISFGYERAKQGKKVWLYRINTSQEFEKHGLATKLIQTMEYIARNNGVYYAEGFYFPENEKVAHTFYLKNGYQLNFNDGENYIFKHLIKEPKHNEIINALEAHEKIQSCYEN